MHTYACVCAGDVLRTMKEGSRAWVSADRLLKCCFEDIGGLPMAQITKLRKFQKVGHGWVQQAGV